MNNYQDFGFNSSEFLGEITSVPYCQFLNAGSQKYGIAITPANAELAGFQSINTWQHTAHEFSDGTNETLVLTKQPRLLILNRSKPLMSDGVETIPYSKIKFQKGGFKAFSYVVVWFLDNNNQPLSELPFRLKCSGYAGLTFLKNYSYYNNSHSFCKKFLQTYKKLTGDRAIDKNDVFYAHAVYQLTLSRQKATSALNGQSSFAVMTNSFVEPNEANFASMIIKNGSEVSHKIKQLMETTVSWLKTESIESEEVSEAYTERHETTNTQPEFEISSLNGIEAGLTPEPIAF